MSNLVGCILTRQLPFQTYLAAYFCCVDFCLTAQYLYYYKYKPPSEESSPISASTPLLEEGLAHLLWIHQIQAVFRCERLLSTSRLAAQFRRYSHARALHKQVSVTRSCPLPSRPHPQQTGNFTRTADYCCEYRSRCRLAPPPAAWSPTIQKRQLCG